MSLKLKKFSKIYDTQSKFVGFFVGKWGDEYIRVALVPGDKEDVDIKDIVDVDALEKDVMNHALFSLTATREKLLKKLHKEYGKFPERENFSYVFRYAIDHRIKISRRYTTNILYILLHKGSIAVEDNYISLIRQRESYPEIDVVRKLETTRVYGKKLRGYIGQISGNVEVNYKTILVDTSSGVGYSSPRVAEVIAPFTTGDATINLHIPFYVDFQYGDFLVAHGARVAGTSDLLEVSSIYSLSRGVLWRIK